MERGSHSNPFASDIIGVLDCDQLHVCLANGINEVVITNLSFKTFESSAAADSVRTHKISE